MLLVICGAGASYDSAPSRQPTGQLGGRSTQDQFRPPLANELFGDRGFFGPILQKYPQCLPVIPRLRHIAHDSSVEAELQRLQAEIPEYFERHAQLAAIRYYLQEVLSICGASWQSENNFITNYLTLVDDIKRFKKRDEKVCFVTFNYDTILDDALGRAGYPFRDMDSYIARDLMLVKLHGSVNWGRKVDMLVDRLPHNDRQELARALIERYSSLQILKPHLLIGVGEAPPAYRDNMPVVPALAIPVEEKLDFECPDQHVEALKAFLPKVTKILTIGWRGTEKSFMELLRKGFGNSEPKTVMVVSGSKKEAENTAQRLRAQGRVPVDRMICSDFGFSDYVTKNIGTEFLRARN